MCVYVVFFFSPCDIIQFLSVVFYVVTAVHKFDFMLVEIKCQLDATEVFIADLIACSTCFGHHYAHHQELKSIIQWLLPVVFCAVVFSSSWSGVELRVMCPVCRMLPHPANRTHNPQLHTRPAT